jgi:hypothetical protein
MFRRFLRIICVAGMVVIVGMAVAGQFWWIALYTPNGHVEAYAAGVEFRLNYVYVSSSQWLRVHHERNVPWRASALLTCPHFFGTPDPMWLLLPWWLLLLTGGLLTALIWRLTRRRQVPHGFPIEPSVKPQ